ncbi:CPSF A subunit region-domain-containing protein [Mycotypha africana]|uniref:CPSF A subunit region-domain-containing protein n=1 Tax=Mycotypha africana TaxID=64632 RepID=UPI0023001ED5|nr:CPSF A subunit region-domain-containing protein [Mycotypha africana]KAI8973376.1 CPSF A subunit region-domain-containing protein [Mycotypha africana]
MSAYTVYKELFPPQTVEHVETGYFTSSDTINLIVAKASLLQIYEFVEYTTSTSTEKPGVYGSAALGNAVKEEEDMDMDRDLSTDRLNEEEDKSLIFPKLKPSTLEEKTLGRLELVAQYKLNGTIATMGVVRTHSPRGKDGCDSLLLGFQDAKMSLLEWSPSTNSIVTVSIHYYERDDYKKEFLTNPYPPNIHIDPQQRCAVLNFFDNKLAVLPFRQQEGDDRIENGADEEEAQKWPYLPSFIIDLKAIDSRIQNIIDMVFLADYYEPTLAILFQTEQTWTGRLANVKDTVSVVVISLDLTAKIYPIIYSIDKLPYDCIKLVALPKPVTGVLVIAANSLLHVSQGSPGLGVAVNGYTQKLTQFPGMIYDPQLTRLGLALDGAQALAFDGGKCVLFLQDGHYVTVQMKMDGNKVVGMHIQEQHEQQPLLVSVPSCVATVKSNEYIFLGSRVGDSLLLKYNSQQASDQLSSSQFEICDHLLNTGPIVDMAIGDVENIDKIKENEEEGEDDTIEEKRQKADIRSNSTKDDIDADKENVNSKNDKKKNQKKRTSTVADLELVTCSGRGKDGALCVFQRHIHPEISFSFKQADSQAIWSIKCKKQMNSTINDTATTVSTSNNTGLVNDDNSNIYDKLLFISKIKNTLVLSAGDELQELVGTGFYTRGPTIAVDTIFNMTRIVQVYATGVMVLTPEGKRLKTIPVRGPKIVDASIQDPYILLKLDNHKILILKGEDSMNATTGTSSSNDASGSGSINNNDIASMSIPSHINKMGSSILLASIFADSTGVFSSVSERSAAEKKAKAVKLAASKQQQQQSKKRKAADEETKGQLAKKLHTGAPTEFDEVDMDLYGEDMDNEIKVSNNSHKPLQATLNLIDGADIDDDDELLYGGQKTDDGKKKETVQDAMVDSLHGQQQNSMKLESSVSTPALKEESDEMIDEANVSLHQGSSDIMQITRVTYWCLLYTTDGVLHIYSLPDFKECFVCAQLDNTPELITDSYHTANNANSNSNNNFADKRNNTAPSILSLESSNTNQIQEILMTHIGRERKYPHLVVRTESNDIIIYKAFNFIPSTSPQGEQQQQHQQQHRLALRFSRVHHEYVSRKAKKSKGDSQKEKNKKIIIDEFEIPDVDLEEQEEDTLVDDSTTSKSTAASTTKKLLFPFKDVAGFTGVFVAGTQPAWLINSCKSFVRVHPMKRHHQQQTEEVIGFTQFHNVNCKHGFITLDAKATIRLSRLRTADNKNGNDNVEKNNSSQMVYDLDWVMQKFPLGKSVHKIVYHPVMKVYAVLVSSPQPVCVTTTEEGGGGQEGVEVANTPTAATNDSSSQQYQQPPPQNNQNEREKLGEFLPQVERYSMIMISPVTWEIVDTVEFEEFEQCISLDCALLESKQTSSGRKNFIVVGTGYLKGEDTTMRGSIHIYDIIEVVPEPNNPQTNHKFKHLYTEDVKGAVTAMCNVSGHLAACIGSKVIVYSLEDDESLVGVAFIDVQIYVTSMSSIKNFILIGDVQKSIWFLGFQIEPAKLTLLGKDYQSFEVCCVDYIIDDKSLYLVVGDDNENVDLYQYAPFNLQSFGGQKLMRRGDFHVGSQVQTMVRLPQIEYIDDDEDGDKDNNKGGGDTCSSVTPQYSRRHFCICGSLSGSLSVITPITEKTFKRLSTMYGQLVNNVQHVAGLNPRAYRLIKGPKQRMSSNRTKAVLDGDLIFTFAGLSMDNQKELTKQIGTTVPRIMEDLVDIESSIDHF